MKQKKLAAKALNDFYRLIQEVMKVETVEEAEKLNDEFAMGLSDEDVKDYKFGVRRVGSILPEKARFEQAWISEVSIEIAEKGIRISYFVNSDAKLIGRSYTDKANVSSEEIRKHLWWWDNILNLGRPRNGIALPLSDEKIYELIDTRDEWCIYDRNDFPSRKIKIKDAIRQIIDEHDLAEMNGPTYDENVRSIKLAYNREQLRRRKK